MPSSLLHPLSRADLLREWRLAALAAFDAERILFQQDLAFAKDQGPAATEEDRRLAQVLRDRATSLRNGIIV